jgi:hypothetical protein
MGVSIGEEQWLWVIVQDPGGNEQFLGVHDEEQKESFIPVFLEKEEALEGLKGLPRQEGHTYEVQAIRYGQLAPTAAEQGFMLFVVTRAGEVLEKIQP